MTRVINIELLVAARNPMRGMGRKFVQKIILTVLAIIMTFNLLSSSIDLGTLLSYVALNRQSPLTGKEDLNSIEARLNDEDNFISLMKRAYGSITPISNDNKYFRTVAISSDPFEALTSLGTVAFVGDIGTSASGIKTIDALLLERPDIVVILGDMGYSSSTSLFEDQVNRLRNSGIDVMCVVGNHDSDEQETDSTELNYWNLCAGGTSGQGFWKLMDGLVTLVGVNTQCDGNLEHSLTSCDKSTIARFLATIPSESPVIVASHKPLCETPSSKHPSFPCTSAFYDQFNRLHEFRVGGHNHCMAWKIDKNVALSGSGGRSNYECTGSGWWIDDTHYGYLLMTEHPSTLDFVFKNQDRVEISQHFVFYNAVYHYDPFFTATGYNFRERSDRASLDLASSFSIASWFKTSKNYTADGYIVNKGGQGSEAVGSNLNYGLWIGPDELIRFGFEASTGANNWLRSPHTYNDGRWHFAVGVFDDSANSLRLYIDGMLSASRTGITAVPETNSKPLRVGVNSQSYVNFFAGSIDEVKLWKNIVLTSSQVADIYDGYLQGLDAPVLSLSFQ